MTTRLLGGALDEAKSYVGLEEMAKILERSQREVERLMERYPDPLPVRYRGRVPYLRHDALVAWLERQDVPAPTHLELVRLRRQARSSRLASSNVVERRRPLRSASDHEG